MAAQMNQNIRYLLYAILHTINFPLFQLIQHFSRMLTQYLYISHTKINGFYTTQVYYLSESKERMKTMVSFSSKIMLSQIGSIQEFDPTHMRIFNPHMRWKHSEKSLCC